MNERDIERFWSKVDRTGDCWLWTTGLDAYGYGQFSLSGRPVKAHRVSYELVVGPIPEGLSIDHVAERCSNRACVNPAHMEPVTRGENVLRGTGPTAVNARKTHCYKGHPLSGSNLVMDAGQRRCRACRNAAKRDQYQRARALASGSAAS